MVEPNISLEYTVHSPQFLVYKVHGSDYRGIRASY